MEKTEDLRKLVTKRVISEIKPIKGADFIELAKVGGWQSVIKKGQFKVGDEVYYFEIDSFLPETVDAFSFLQKSQKQVINPNSEEQELVTGHVLRTVKLRGVVSQGLLLPLDEFPPLDNQDEVTEYFKGIGVFKYEKPVPASHADIYKGGYPQHITQKTDSERVQNLSDEFLQSLNPDEWVATEKVDGTSTTFIKQNGQLRVCSRNYEYDLDEIRRVLPNHVILTVIDQYNLQDTLPDNFIIKAELVGPKIQSNPLKLAKNQLIIFDCHDLQTGEVAWDKLPDSLRKLKTPTYALTFPTTVDEAIESVNKIKSLINPKVYAEGVVWWHKNGQTYVETGSRPNFKVISNHYLVKERD